MFGAYYGVSGGTDLFDLESRIGVCMTSESETSKRRRPPTIDLTATEVESEKPASAQAAGPELNEGAPVKEEASESSSVHSGSSIGTMVASGAAGAIVVAAIVAV